MALEGQADGLVLMSASNPKRTSGKRRQMKTMALGHGPAFPMKHLPTNLLIALLGLLCVSCSDNRTELEKAMYPNGTPSGVTFEEASGDSPMDDEPRNRRGEAFLRELVQTIESSDRIVAIEHSYIYDTGDVDIKLSPERKYKTVLLTTSDRAALASTLGATDPHVSMFASACIFEPHHRLEFYKGSRKIHALEVCFGCGQLELDGSPTMEPGAVYSTLDAFLRRIGMSPEQDWVVLARGRPSAG